MKRKHLLSLVLPLLALAFTLQLAAPAFADSWLDPTFGGDGIVYTDFEGGADEARDLVILPDGALVAAGIGSSKTEFPPQGFAVARYLPDGTLDPAFGQDGWVLTFPTGNGDRAYAVVAQPDGALVVGGQAGAETSDFGLVRHRADGSLDETFGGDGIVTTNLGRVAERIADVALQPDGRIVAVGETRTGDDGDVALARYNPDGSPDASFSGDGIVVTQVGADSTAGVRVRLLPGGKILALATRYGATPAMILLRYNADGSLDATFDGDGIAVPNIGANGGTPNDMLVLPSGKILLAGTFGMGEAFGVARVNADGTIDNTFGVDGRALTPQGINGVTAVLTQPHGRILVAGRYLAGGKTYFGVTRFMPSGSLDMSFGQDGVMYADVGLQPVPWAMALDAKGSLTLAGTQEMGSVSGDFTLARFALPEVVMRPVWLPMAFR